jgi:hypothetical protein
MISLGSIRNVEGVQLFKKDGSRFVPKWKESAFDREAQVLSAVIALCNRECFKTMVSLTLPCYKEVWMLGQDFFASDEQFDGYWNVQISRLSVFLYRWVKLVFINTNRAENGINGDFLRDHFLMETIARYAPICEQIVTCFLRSDSDHPEHVLVRLYMEYFEGEPYAAEFHLDTRLIGVRDFIYRWQFWGAFAAYKRKVCKNWRADDALTLCYY